MARPARYKVKKVNIGKKIIAWIAVLAILTGAIIFFVTNYFDDTKTKLEKMNYPQDYSEYVNKAAEEYNLEPALIYAVIHTESGFNSDAHSSAGACGIMQMMPESFEWLQDKRGCSGMYSENDLYNPEICIDYGCYLLRYFYDYFGTERAAIAAYNAGFVVGDWLENSDYSSDGINLELTPYPETSNYIDKVENAKEMYIKLYYS